MIIFNRLQFKSSSLIIHPSQITTMPCIMAPCSNTGVLWLHWVSFQESEWMECCKTLILITISICLFTLIYVKLVANKIDLTQKQLHHMTKTLHFMTKSYYRTRLFFMCIFTKSEIKRFWTISFSRTTWSSFVELVRFANGVYIFNDVSKNKSVYKNSSSCRALRVVATHYQDA